MLRRYRRTESGNAGREDGQGQDDGGEEGEDCCEIHDGMRDEGYFMGSVLMLSEGDHVGMSPFFYLSFGNSLSFGFLVAVHSCVR